MEPRLEQALKYFIKRLDELEEKIKILDIKIDQLLDVKKPIPSEEDDMACPKCGAPLVKKQAKATGREFLGCSTFYKTKCGGTRQIK